MTFKYKLQNMKLIIYLEMRYLKKVATVRLTEHFREQYKVK